jgi:hypothetical protein
MEWSGSQAEHVEVGEQWMPLEPSVVYEVRWTAEGLLDGIEVILPDGRAVAARVGKGNFRSGGAGGRLAIRYARAEGKARMEGETAVTGFQIEGHR